MLERGSSQFGIVDYCVFAGMLVFSGAIGLYTSYIGNKSPEEFLMGNRSFKPMPVAMSLLTSFVSSISLLGYSGEVYAYGAQISMFVLGVILAILFSMYFALPVLYPLKLTSVTEYVELRFKSERLRLVISFLTLLKSLLYLGVCLYAPTIALVTVTKLNTMTYIFLLGVICTIYSAFGGIRGVIWTDVFQLSVMMVGLISVTIIGCVQNGGFIKTLNMSVDGGRVDIFDFNPSPLVRHTFLNVIAFGFFLYIHTFGSDQINMQRMCSVKTMKNAKSVLTYNIYGMILIYFLIFVGGLVAYATYQGCDPMALGIIEKKEEIMTFFLIDKLSFIPGLPGIFVATLIGGTLSSLSSVINASVALIWEDACLKFSFFKNASVRCATLTNKILSIIIGIFLVGMAIIASNANSVIELSNTITGAFSGPILGVYLIGYIFPKCNNKGVWTGFILSTVFIMWVSVCGFLYKEIPEMLPFSTDKCDSMNFTLTNITKFQMIPAVGNATKEVVIQGSFIEPLYHISYTLYPVLGPLVCVIVAIIVSCLTGNQSLEETSPKYVAPCLRRFYWKEEELEYLRERERKLSNLDFNIEGNNKLKDFEKMMNFIDED